MSFLVFIIFNFLIWFPEWLEPLMNYPGLELWKFANLFIFVVCGFYLHRRFGRPIREALRSRSEGIKRELAKAQQERDQALAKLAEVDLRFADLDVEVGKIQERAKVEAASERQRIEVATQQEIEKIRAQAKREIESAGKVARNELRRFAALESVRLAEEILKTELRPNDDLRLTLLSVEQLGRKAS